MNSNMDPEETQSEAGGWKSTASIGSMSFMDTRSEPPLSMADKLLLKKLRSGKKSNTVVPVDAPLTNNSTKASSSLTSSSTSSVVSETRSVTTSSKNAFKLDRKLTQASQVSVGGSGGGTASNSRRSKQSCNSSGVAVGKKAPSLLSSLPTTNSSSSSTKSSSKKHERSSSVKSNTTKKTWSTLSSKEEQSSSSWELALVVPSPVTNDPPTYECYGFHDSTTKGYDNDTNYDSSAYSSSSYDMPKKVIAVIGDEDTQLDTISESDEDTGSGRELVVVRTVKDSNDNQQQQHDALVEYEESNTSQSTNTDDDAGRGALVSAFKSNYLAAAVDNYGAIVPFDSEIYEPYDHTFVSCPEYLRFRFLYTFLKKNLDKKIIIFYSTTESAVFHSKLLSRLNVPKVMMMHGQQKQTRFINTFFKFSDMEDGILCTTDSAGRDLDIPPSVDYVLQFEPPDDPSEYIVRIGRVSCDSDRVGRSILFLNPGETNGFLKYYDSASIPVSEFEVPKMLAEIQSNVERLVNNTGDERMLQYAKNAYGSYLLAYASHGYRDVYNVHDLNKDDVASAFGLLSIPGDDDDDDDDDDSTSFYASRSSSSKRPDTSTTQMVANNKSTKKTWMKGNKKTWPHCRVRVHPMFKNDNAQTEIDSNE